MYELALPGSLAVFPMPDPPECSEGDFRNDLLIGVIAGHALVFWLAWSTLAIEHGSTVSKVLRVEWLAVQPPSAVALLPTPHAPQPNRPPTTPVVVAEPTLVAFPANRTAIYIAEPPSVEPIPVAAPEGPPERTLPLVITPLPAVKQATPPVEPVTPPSYHADYLNNPSPDYPQLSRRMGEEGTVRLRVHVTADGLPLEVRVESGSGYDRLDRAAIHAVARWQFLPARLGNQVVSGWVVVPISFVLRR